MCSYHAFLTYSPFYSILTIDHILVALSISITNPLDHLLVVVFPSSSLTPPRLSAGFRAFNDLKTYVYVYPYLCKFLSIFVHHPLLLTLMAIIQSHDPTRGRTSCVPGNWLKTVHSLPSSSGITRRPSHWRQSKTTGIFGVSILYLQNS